VQVSSCVREHSIMRRPAVLVTLLGAATVLLRKRGKARKAERELWTEASKGAAEPDLR
jgi:hypothetical protein